MKFNELASGPYDRMFTMRMKGKNYKTCVRAVMMCGILEYKVIGRGHLEKNRKSHGNENVWSESGGQEM